MDTEIQKSRKPKMIPVKVIKARVDNALVEYQLKGVLQRCTIPTSLIENGAVPDDELSYGIPYGIAWENVELSASSKDLANMLRIQGIWTVEDAMSNPNKIVAALQAVYKIDLAKIIGYARDNK